MSVHPGIFFGSMRTGHASNVWDVLPEDTSVVFAIHGEDGGCWTVARRGDVVGVEVGESVLPDCRLACSTEVFSHLVGGTLSPQEALSRGLIEVEGDVGLMLALRRRVVASGAGQG